MRKEPFMIARPDPACKAGLAGRAPGPRSMLRGEPFGRLRAVSLSNGEHDNR